MKEPQILRFKGLRDRSTNQLMDKASYIEMLGRMKIDNFRVHINTGVAYYAYATHVCCIRDIFRLCNIYGLHTRNISRMQYLCVAYAKYVACATDYHKM